MKAAWPAGPILIIIVSFGLVLGSIVYVSHENQARRNIEMVNQENHLPQTSAPNVGTLQPNRPDQAKQHINSILAHSAFAPDRSEFTLSKPASPSPPKSKFSPEFVGTLGSGDTLRALVIWSQNGEAQTHRVGDETPWGELVSIETTRLEFSAPDGMKQLELF